MLNEITTFLKKNILFFFSSAIFKALQLSSLYLISFATYVKLLESYLPRTSKKIFLIFPFLKYLAKNKILSYFVTKRTIYFFGFFFRYYRYFSITRKYIRLSKLTQFNLNYLVILESIAFLFFNWWHIFFAQGNSPLKVENKIRYFKITKLEITLLVSVTFCYIIIFAYSFLLSVLGICVYIPIISESAMMWTEGDLRYRNLRNRYSRERNKGFFL